MPLPGLCPPSGFEICWAFFIFTLFGSDLRFFAKVPATFKTALLRPPFPGDSGLLLPLEEDLTTKAFSFVWSLLVNTGS